MSFVDLTSASDTELLNMRAAAADVREAMWATYRADTSVVGELLRHEETFEFHDHYPDDDARDPESGSQYYYHWHRDGEHGHFHCFIMEAGLPDHMAPIPDQRLDLRDPDFTETFSHLIAISMDDQGHPQALFTTNRWVTQDVIFPAEQIIGLLDRFSINHTFPSWATNRWLTAMIVLFRKHIEKLIRQREKEFERLAAEEPGTVIFENTDHEVLSEVSISIDEHVEAIDSECQRRGLL